uniref:Rho GTPase-activating protein 26 n=1 Tax=Oreochromis niloticus TaxID=8128 RepID=A0A669CZF2_ORENI
MGLPALEFSDCYLDSPQFRERLKSHELELDKTNKFIKELIKDSKALIQALKSLSTAKRKFADSLNDFKFQCIGDAETDDEICIGECADIENANDVLILPLERFRKEQISAAKEAKKKYDKETEKYCAVLEKHLSLSAKKKEAHLLEADNQVDNVRQHFYEVSLEYVFKVQEVQERKMFDFVEPVRCLQNLFILQHIRLVMYFPIYKNRFESTRSEVESLMRKMKENPHEHKSVSQHTMEGYLFVQEKRSFVSTWVKYYCTYYREPKKVTMVLFDPKSGGKTGEEESFILKSCTRRKTDSIEKRFCFDVEAVDRPGVITMQALSEEDRRLWMEAMDGREPVGYSFLSLPSPSVAQLDVIGFNVMKKFIYAVETRGIDEQGLYRIAGVNSKIQKLLNLLVFPEKPILTCSIFLAHNLLLTSYVSRMLPAPLMTYQYQRSFIKAAKMDNPEARVTEVHALVHRLPEKNRQMLELLVKHLANVASHHQQNLMTIANLGVVFGPTLLRPQEETVAAIMDIKFQNIVVEILIEHHERIFRDMPNSSLSNTQLNTPRRRSTDSKTPSCSERPLTLFHTPTHSHKGKLKDMTSLLHGINMRCYLSSFYPILLTCHDSMSFSVNMSFSATSSSPTSPRSPSWPMFSAPSSPQPISSASSDSSPVSFTGRKARALYACKAEHDSELSFIAGTIFENVHASREPGWLEGTLDGRTGLIPENYVEFV